MNKIIGLLIAAFVVALVLLVSWALFSFCVSCHMPILIRTGALSPNYYCRSIDTQHRIAYDCYATGLGGHHVQEYHLSDQDGWEK